MKLIVVHPYRLISDAMKCILSSQDEFEIVGSFQSTEDVIAYVTGNTVDTIVISGMLVEATPTEVIGQIKEAAPGVGIVVVATAPRSDELVRLLESGISGYVSLECTAVQLADSVRKVAAGEVVLCGIDRSAMVPGGTNGHAADTDNRAAAVESLTPREREVLALLSRGFSNRQIADNLYLSEHTVRTHVQNLRGKLNVRSKFEAAMIAMRSGSSTGSVTSQMRF